MLAHEGRAQNLMGLGVSHDLHEAAARILDDGAGIAEHGALAHHSGNAPLLGLSLGDAHHGDLRRAVNAAGDHVQVNVVGHAVHALHAGGALRGASCTTEDASPMAYTPGMLVWKFSSTFRLLPRVSGFIPSANTPSQ